MIEIEKNEYIKICDKTYLCYCQRWGSDEYYYMVIIHQNLYGAAEIYGWGQSAEWAMFMAIQNLVKLGLKSISLEYDKDDLLKDFMESFIKKEGRIAPVENGFLADLSKLKEKEKYFYVRDQHFAVIFEDEKCYPIIE